MLTRAHDDSFNLIIKVIKGHQECTIVDSSIVIYSMLYWLCCIFQIPPKDHTFSLSLR